VCGAALNLVTKPIGGSINMELHTIHCANGSVESVDTVCGGDDGKSVDRVSGGGGSRGVYTT
jgi:hypothetical protein